MSAQPEFVSITAALARMRANGFGLLLDARGKWAFCDLRQSAAWAAKEFGEDDPLAYEVIVHCESVGLDCDTMEQAVQDAMEWLDGKRFQERTAARDPAEIAAERRAAEREYQRDCREDR